MAATAAGPDQAAARDANATERAAILRTWAIFTARQGQAEPRRCYRTWAIRVAPSRPWLASMFPRQRLRVQLRCPLGDGYVLFQRPGPRSGTWPNQRWRIRMMGSGVPPPCRLMPPLASRQLGFGGDCSR